MSNLTLMSIIYCSRSFALDSVNATFEMGPGDKKNVVFLFGHTGQQ